LERKSIVILLSGLLSLSAQFGCQGPTLVTTVGPPLSEAVEGMLYYLPIGKITIKGDSSAALTLAVTARRRRVEADQRRARAVRTRFRFRVG
jgi:hypothetical protein